MRESLFRGGIRGIFNRAFLWPQISQAVREGRWGTYVFKMTEALLVRALGVGLAIGLIGMAMITR